jgi:hypothetical protein
MSVDHLHAEDLELRRLQVPEPAAGVNASNARASGGQAELRHIRHRLHLLKD